MLSSRRLLGFALLAGILCASTQPTFAEDVDEKDVLVLTKDNFDDTLKKHKFVLAEFYAPWCGHCKNLAPNYAQAATRLRSDGFEDVVLAKIDTTVEGDLAARYSITAYPSLLWFVKGERQPYTGRRDANSIFNWVKKRLGPATQVAETVEKLKELEGGSAPVVVVAYFDKLEGEDLETFRSVAATVEDVAFVETTSKEVAAQAGLMAPGIAAIRNVKGEPRGTQRFPVPADALRSWAATTKIPLTVLYDNNNLDLIFRSGVKKQLILWAKTEQLKPGNTVYDAFAAVAPKFRGQLVFTLVDIEGVSLSSKMTAEIGLEGWNPPVVAGLWMEGQKKWIMDMTGEVTEAKIEAFAQSVVDGTAQAHLKSQPIPDEPYDGEVAVVVGQTLEAIALDDSKDVMLEVYAPWCGHCKSLAPVYQELAQRFSSVDSVVIAKMDGTVNEHSQVKVDGYPTIFFKPAGSTTLQLYTESGRTLEDLTKYIQDNAKVPFTLPVKQAAKEEL